MICLPESVKMVEALAPASDAAGRTGAYVSLKYAGTCYVVCHVNQGNSATVTLTPKQATDVSGSGEKVLSSAVPIWSNLDCAASDTLVKRTDAVDYTTDAATKAKVVVFQIDPATLDVAGGFDCVAIVTGASHADNITSAMYYLVDYRYQQGTPPSAVVD